MNNLGDNPSDLVPEVPNFEYDNKELNKDIGSKSLDAVDSSEAPNNHFEDIIENNGIVHELTSSEIENINPEIMNNPDSLATFLIFGTTDREAIFEHERSDKRTKLFNCFYPPMYYIEQAPTNIDTFFEANPDTDVQDLMDSLPEAFVVDYIGSFAKHGADVAKVFSSLSPDMLRRILKEAHGDKFQEFRELDRKQNKEKRPNPGRLPFRK